MSTGLNFAFSHSLLLRRRRRGWGAVGPLARQLGVAWLLVAAGAGLAQVAPAETGTRFRVCLPDFAIAPFLLNDPLKLGSGEQMIVDAAREVGMPITLDRAPNRRCLAMIDAGETDAIISSPVPANLKVASFPMRGTAVDAALRVARLSLVVLRPQGSAFGWDGKRFSGPRSPVVGTRIGFNSAIGPLRAMGLTVNEQAQTTEQLLRMLAAGRFDLAVVLQEEADTAAMARKDDRLEVLAPPLLVADFHLAVRPKLVSDNPDAVQALWAAIGRLRERRLTGR